MQSIIKSWPFIVVIGCTYAQDADHCELPPGSGHVSGQAGGTGDAAGGVVGGGVAGSSGQSTSGSGGVALQGGASGEGGVQNVAAGKAGQAGVQVVAGDGGEHSIAGEAGRAGGQSEAANCPADYQTCNGRCIALASDPDNCGRCGVACSFPNGLATCISGTCYMEHCVPGYVDTNLDPSDGCECRRTNPSTEICDGVDNDCDGKVDYVEKMWGYSSPCPCVDTKLILKDGEPDLDGTNNGSCTTRACGVGADGVSPWMAFCCSKGTWGQCKFSSANLNDFDADQRGQGALEVVVELSGSVSGLGLSLWYGNYPKRKKLVILDGHEGTSIGPGKVTRIFYPEDAQCPVYTEKDLTDQAFTSFPEACAADDPAWTCTGGKWSALSPDCAFDYDASTVYLTAERCSAEVRTSVSLVSLRRIGDTRGCSCASDLGCSHAQRCDFADPIAAPWCAASSPSCAGICSDPAVDVSPCTGLVGLYAGGVAKSGSTGVFFAACMRHQPHLGVPLDNRGGSQYVHTACNNGVQVQDYLQADPAKAISRDGQTMLILNPDLDEAYLLYDDFWLAYACATTIDGCISGMGGSSLLGAPTDEKHQQGDLIRQNFTKGWMSLGEHGSCVMVHLNQPPASVDYSFANCPDQEASGGFCVKLASP